jgi:hypothetical protein
LWDLSHGQTIEKNKLMNMEFFRVVPDGYLNGYETFKEKALKYAVAKQMVLAGAVEYEHLRTHPEELALGPNIKKVFFCGMEFETGGNEFVVGLERANGGIGWQECAADLRDDFYPWHYAAIVRLD